ncbi:hypothetical protein PR202_ga16643 [Eleusine coracana subsp. coracana]|uniref:TFIIS N-terminal domain-containing protein n=1 Tax=Eleusine coracana subsp. coracana TaxID=191504 RepID=A0AAV5CNA3_ELECO|nr:hypothetical protein QOZ80_6AG0526110 [Eleusine coracana subsp. coracana]GJM99535.1 hypothetical protein PR202_ga16643 [Eleusine coracana subsp. coracana]
MAARSPLRRWKRFFSVFDTIDAAIVAAGSSSGGDEVGCAEELRQAKGAAVQLLCDSPEDDEAEGHCRILDQVMVEYLVTLESVPVSPSALASTGLAAAVGALQDHESDQIRGLARSMVGKWSAAVESDLAEARARVEELRKLSHETLAIKMSPKLSKKSAPVVANAISTPFKMPATIGIDKMEATKQKLRAGYQEAEDAKLQRKIIIIEAPKIIKQQQQPKRPAKISTPLLTKKSAPVVGVGRASMATTTDQTPTMMNKKMEATKRKLREGYQEAEDAKRQRKIVLIDPPKMVEQRQRKVHPVTRERSQARCATSAVRRRSWMPSFCRV